MRIIIIMLTLLVAPYWLLMFTNVPEGLRRRIGIALVFLLTSVGHFEDNPHRPDAAGVGRSFLMIATRAW